MTKGAVTINCVMRILCTVQITRSRKLYEIGSRHEHFQSIRIFNNEEVPHTHSSHEPMSKRGVKNSCGRLVGWLSGFIVTGWMRTATPPSCWPSWYHWWLHASVQFGFLFRSRPQALRQWRWTGHRGGRRFQGRGPRSLWWRNDPDLVSTRNNTNTFLFVQCYFTNMGTVFIQNQL